jgi:signal transduction histidine kinase/ActR/RegA family two-component response regulator
MMIDILRDIEERVLILGSSDADAASYEAALDKADIGCEAFSELGDLCGEIENGCGAILLTAEAVVADGEGCLIKFLREQPAWSDLPVIVVIRQGSDSPLADKAFENLGNVAMLEHPVRDATLVSAVGVALRSRQRQYQIRAYLSERQQNEHALKEADRRKDEFLAMLAHELRNPLAPIRSALELLRIDREGESATMAHDIMDRQVRHLVRLVDDLLDVSRIVRGRIELRKEVVELSLVLGHAIEVSRGEIDAHHHKLVVDADPSLCVLGDSTRLAQVVANLLNNASKYTDDGGTIWLTTKRDGASAIISIRDNGSGIAPEVLPTVFDLFIQADRTIQRSRGGLGIGLTLVRRLAELHGGTVSVRSDGPGHGSEFIVCLSVLDRAVTPESQQWKPSSVVPRRVLVVDDNVGATTILERMLTGFWKHDVCVAHNGVDALTVARRDRPEVVILDIGLPGISGFDVVRQLRQDAHFERTLFVCLTGYGQLEDRLRSSEAGFDEHLVKPASVEALESLFRHPKLETRDRSES